MEFNKRELLSITKPINFGKYKRKSLRIVARDDPKYFIWLYESKPFVILTKKVREQYKELYTKAQQDAYGGIEQDNSNDIDWDESNLEPPILAFEDINETREW